VLILPCQGTVAPAHPCKSQREVYASTGSLSTITEFGSGSISAHQRGSPCPVRAVPHLNGLQLDEVEDLGGGVRIVARSRSDSAPCHRCGGLSVRVHDRYRRRVDDLSCAGRPVAVDLEVRRFRCGQVSVLGGR
jgi:hypothetical protein